MRDRYVPDEVTTKHLPGEHNQRLHGKKLVSSALTIATSRKQAVKRILRNLDANNVPVVISAELPEIDFGGGDIGVPTGVYDDDTGVITLYGPAFSDGEHALYKTLSHETTHARYRNAKLNFPEKYARFETELYPILQQHDGVNAYSKLYWQNYENPPENEPTFGDVSIDNAVNETLAEIKSHKLNNPDYKPHALWDMLANEIAKDSAVVVKHLPGRHNQKLHGSAANGTVVKAVKYGKAALAFINSGKSKFTQAAGGKDVDSLSLEEVRQVVQKLKFGNGKVDITFDKTGFTDKESKLIEKCANWLRETVAAPADIIPAKVALSSTGYSEATEDSIVIARNEYLAEDLAHEYGHWVENLFTNKAAKDFLNARKTGIIDDSDGEIIWDDTFIDSYAGKQYMNQPAQNTEIVASGFEHLYRDPGKFAKFDPDHFYFTLGMISPWKNSK